MAERVDEDAWSARLAAQVGGAVKTLRERHQPRLTAQQLADRTAAIGHEVPRSVIANLESGRRGVITVPDVLVLARALDVPPIHLLMPPEGQRVELLPNRRVGFWEAVGWIAGLSELSAVAPWAEELEDDQVSRQQLRAAGRPYRLYEEARSANRSVAGHSITADTYRRRAEQAEGAEEQQRMTYMAEREADLATRSVQALVAIEDEIRDLGWPAPVLSQAHQEDEPFEPIEFGSQS